VQQDFVKIGRERRPLGCVLAQVWCEALPRVPIEETRAYRPVEHSAYEGQIIRQLACSDRPAISAPWAQIAQLSPFRHKPSSIPLRQGCRCPPTTKCFQGDARRSAVVRGLPAGLLRCNLTQIVFKERLKGYRRFLRARLSAKRRGQAFCLRPRLAPVRTA